MESVTFSPASKQTVPRVAIGVMVVAGVAVALGLVVTRSWGLMALASLGSAALLCYLAVTSVGIFAGLIVLALLNGIPGIDFTSLSGSLSAKRMTDLLVLVLAVGICVSGVARGGLRASAWRGRSRALTLLWSAALTGWWLVTFIRSVAISDVPPAQAFAFGQDFLLFALLLPLLASALAERREMVRFIVVLLAGVAVFTVGAIMTQVSGSAPGWLIHIDSTAVIDGITRVYAPMTDLVTASVPIAIGLMVLGREGKYRLLGVMLLSLAGVATLLQLTRARYGALVVGCLAVGVIWLFRRASDRLRIGRAFTGLVAIVLAIGVLAPATLHVAPLQSAVSRVTAGLAEIQNDSGTVGSRYGEANVMTQELGAQWPIGLGFIPPSAHYFVDLPAGSIRNTDLGVLNGVMTMGVIGTILLYVPFVGLVFAMASSGGAREDVSKLDWLSYGLAAWAVVAVLGSVTLATLYSVPGLVLSAALLALGIRLCDSGRGAPGAEGGGSSDMRRSPGTRASGRGWVPSNSSEGALGSRADARGRVAKAGDTTNRRVAVSAPSSTRLSARESGYTSSVALPVGTAVVAGWNSPLAALRLRVRGGNLTRAAIGTFTLRVTARFLALPTAILLARLMGPAEYGRYAYALAWATILGTPAVMGLDRYLIRAVAHYDAVGDWAHMRGLMRWATTRVLGVSTILAVVAAVGSAVFVKPAFKDAFWIGLVLVPLVALTIVRQAALQGLRHVQLSFVPEMLIFPGLLLVMIVVVGITGIVDLNATTAVALNVGAAVVAFAVGVELLRRRIPPQVKSVAAADDRRTWLRSALPLALFGLVSIGYTQIAVLLLGSLGTSHDVGVYQVAARMTDVLSFGLAAIVAPLAPMASRLHTLGQRDRLQALTTGTARAAFAFTAPLALVMILARYPLLRLFGHGFEDGGSVLVILTVGQLVNAFMGPVAVLLLMTGYEREAAATSLLAVAVAICLTLILFPVAGVDGAAWGSAAALTTWNVSLAVLTRRRLGIRATVFARARGTSAVGG